MGSFRVEALCRTKCHVPKSCSSSQLVLRTWMLPSLASPVWRHCRLHAGDRSISLVGFRARRCSFSGTVAESCAWYSRCCLDSLRRTVGSEFHLLNLGKFEPEPFCSSHFVQHCAPRLVVLGKRWRCLLEEANTDVAPVMRALQRKCHILSRGCPSPNRVSSFPFVLAGPRVADASVMNEQKRVRF